MRRSGWLVLARVLSASLALMGAVVFAFLCYWYWEVVLWTILAPLGFTSLYLSWTLWRPTRATSRAVICWAVSVVWVLGLVMISFKDTTVIGGALAAALALGLVALVYGCVQKSVTSA